MQKNTQPKMRKIRIKKGDYVQIVSGQDAGKKGKVLRILHKQNRVIIEGIQYIIRHTRKTEKNSQGGRVQKESPIHISNVMLYCPHTQKPTRTTYRFEEVKEKVKDAEGVETNVEHAKHIKVRYSKKSNRQIK